MAIADYLGRTHDLLAYTGGDTAGGETLLTQELATTDNGGQITTGIQKLAQRFLLELLTEQGSLTYLPDRGCDFMAKARLGNFLTPLDVLAAFSGSLVDIRNNLEIEESESDPDDERFLDAEAESVTLNAGSATLHIRVTSRAGNTRKVIAPLNITI